ncbi:hypothetical protein MNBD_UNCLBAC01-1207 [hydrothermal vent metagenome]|uniref:PIN domain-containing protein n=1 Tax=hydrothermal vent metagenome TaxID=652676 RepID=A0A3B1DFW0_9ZZZZ
MRAFIDTSSLIKKYKYESGREEFLEILNSINEIIVSAVTYIELLCTLQRICEEFKWKKNIFLRIKKEIDLDYSYFKKVPLTENLEEIAFTLRQKNKLKSLDLIQLSSAIISKPNIFITSDKQLYKIAKKELNKVILI